MSLKTKVVLGVIAVSLIWGSTWLGIKVGLETVPPILAAALRFFVASGILFVMMKAQRLSVPREPQFYRVIVVMSLLSYAIPFALIYWGQHRIPTGLASILFATFPFWVASFVQMRVHTERLTIAKIISLLLGFGGVIVIFAGNIAFNESHSVWGMLAIVIAAGMQAFSLIAVKIDGEKYSSVVMNFVSMLIGGLLLQLMSLALESYSSVVFDRKAVMALFYLAIVGSVGAFVIYFWLVKHVEAVMLSLISFVTPVLAVVLGAVVLGESLSSNILIGSVLVLVGILSAHAEDISLIVRGKKGTIR